MYTERPVPARAQALAARRLAPAQRSVYSLEFQGALQRWFVAARRFAYLVPFLFLRPFPAAPQRRVNDLFVGVLAEDTPQQIALRGVLLPLLEFLILLRVDRPLHWIAHPRFCAIREVNQAHLVMRVEGVTRVATGDVQVPEVLAGLDVCVGQPLLKLGDNDLFPVRFFTVRFFVLLETGTDLL